MQGAIQKIVSHGKILKNAALGRIHLGNAEIRPAVFSQFESFSSVGGAKRRAGTKNRNSDVLKAKDGRTLRQFTLSKGKSAGRNSSGRITAFHRGGGAKRLQRIVDLKRSTLATGIVERIEYDPNRSGRLALVRWVEGVRPKKLNTMEKFTPPDKNHEPITTTIRGKFSFSSMPGKVEQRKVACWYPAQRVGDVVVGLPAGMPPPSKSPCTSEDAGRKKTSVRDVFLSAFSSPKSKGEAASVSFVRSSGLPRIAVAGAKPTFFASQMSRTPEEKNTFSLSEVQQWRTDSDVWAHRMKRKAALSWHRFKQQDTLGLVGAAERNESKP
uniref:60S ribosomal protein L2, mitochondrial n=1 Tax=Hypseocharis bilobata TaxID=253189 RepID=A0A0G2YJ09_9ROSI|nr:ribosomal protein L2 [Hypseocharis bilobata]